MQLLYEVPKQHLDKEAWKLSKCPTEPQYHSRFPTHYIINDVYFFHSNESFWVILEIRVLLFFDWRPLILRYFFHLLAVFKLLICQYIPENAFLIKLLWWWKVAYLVTSKYVLKNAHYWGDSPMLKYSKILSSNYSSPWKYKTLEQMCFRFHKINSLKYRKYFQTMKWRWDKHVKSIVVFVVCGIIPRNCPETMPIQRNLEIHRTPPSIRMLSNALFSTTISPLFRHSPSPKVSVLCTPLCNALTAHVTCL